MENKILNINAVHEVSYPNGIKVRFSIEFKKGIKKGFRSIIQTINPKKRKLSNPEPVKSTYAHFMCQYINGENGHSEYTIFYFSNYQNINPICQFIAENFDALQLTPKMIREIYNQIYISLKATEKYVKADKKKLIELLDPTIHLIDHGIYTAENIFPQINLDVQGIDKLIEEYQNNSKHIHSNKPPRKYWGSFFHLKTS